MKIKSTFLCRPSEAGFTLVELAIVLMIIGLLIGGILRGQELMANARVSSTIQQVKAYTGALITFRDTYSAVPGDLPTALTRLPGCNTGNNCRNGNGDGVVGVLGVDSAAHPWTNVPNGIATENAQFWKHLSLTHLISGVNPAASAAEWGRSNPVAPFGSGFFARYSVLAGGTMYMNISAHMLVLRNQISGEWVCHNTGQTMDCAISPLRASQIDRKMDDGIANTGDAFAISAGWGNGCGMPNTGINGNDGYNSTVEARTCDMMFVMN